MKTRTVLDVVERPAIKLLHEAHIGQVAGFRAVGVHAQIKKFKRDIAIILSERSASAAGVFTKNAVVAAPVPLSRAVAQGGSARAIVCNSGNANAVTGERGRRDALRMQELTAEVLGIGPQEVFVASTGIIGNFLPMDRVESGIREAALLLEGAGPDGSAAEAIMTTDTVPKEIVLQVTTPKGDFRIGGIAKGSGMIAPNMATMLGFLVTDAAVEPSLLQSALGKSADRSFNMISVDHDTSTNDMVLALANGASGLSVGSEIPLPLFQRALDAVTLHLAKAIVRDGEGATKLIEVRVGGAASDEDAKRVAKAVVNSPLVKTAVHGEDPNWGRVLAAVGYSGAKVSLERVSLKLGNRRKAVDVLSHGEPLAFNRDEVRSLLRSEEVRIDIDLGLARAKATAYGCDLSREYVDINAHYTT